MTKPTNPAATRGMGWSTGMAAQLSLPNMLILRPLGCARTGLFDRPRAGRQRLRNDLLEQVGLDIAKGERPHVRALPGEIRIALRGQRRAAVACRIDPGGEAVGRHRLHAEVHVREPVAAVLT